MLEYPRVICTRPRTKIPIVILISHSRTWVAISYGLLLACGHTVVSAVILDTELQLVAQWQTVIANIIILVTVNLVGIFIHNLTEEGQRRAFLDTRDCIAAKLEMEDENEKLVSEFKTMEAVVVEGILREASNLAKYKVCNSQIQFSGTIIISFPLPETSPWLLKNRAI